MAKSTFIVNWEVQGFRGKVHAIGALITAEAEEVEELVKAGAVSLWDKVKGIKVEASATAVVEADSTATKDGTETATELKDGEAAS